MKIEIKKHSLFICLIVMLLALCSLFGSISPQLFASADAYTNVYDDLNKDLTFKESDYPILENDHTLQVVSVAESEKGELFVYVYQPSASHKATSISFSTQKKGKEFKLYYLNYINKFKALYKYVVQDFEVASDETRYYEIASIFRLWNSDIDKEPASGQTISEVSFAVGKQYILTDEETICFDVETIEITDKYVGFVRYESAYNIIDGTKKYVESHFVAFKTDKTIDTLLEADIVFQTQQKSDYGYGDVEDARCEIDVNNQTATIESSAGFQSSFWSWDRVQTTAEFVASEDFTKSYNVAIFNKDTDYKLTQETINCISSCDWVLRFYESEYVRYYDDALTLTPVTHYYRTLVSNVTVLRLAFESSGTVYNLGVVDNKQTGSNDPSNEGKSRWYLNWWAMLILAIFVAVVLLIIFAPSIFLSILKFAWKSICALFKGLWWLITLPLEIFIKEDKNA